MNAYYTNSNTQKKYNSDMIRKAFIAKTRKRELHSFISNLLSIELKAIFKIIFALKVIGGIVCAVSFFTVLSLIEAGSISSASGILCAILIAALECLCFIPFKESKKY